VIFKFYSTIRLAVSPIEYRTWTTSTLSNH